jgi:hypothetical protein
VRPVPLPPPLPDRPKRLLALAAGALLLAVAAPTAAQRYSEWIHQRTLILDAPWGEARVLVSWPRRPGPADTPSPGQYPVLVALHGRGEAQRGRQGHLAWNVRYALTDTFRSLGQLRLSRRDYRGLVRAPHLAWTNRALTRRGYDGLFVVTPAIPDVAGEVTGSERLSEVSDWLAGPLLEEVRGRFEGVATERARTGVDGVSMGGLVALDAGFRHPDVFGTVGAIQPAISGNEAALAEVAETAARRAPQRIRVLTSEGDPFRQAALRFSQALRDRRLTHTVTTVPGPHDYVFNRGPAGVEMLLFHARAAAGE